MNLNVILRKLTDFKEKLAGIVSAQRKSDYACALMVIFYYNNGRPWRRVMQSSVGSTKCVHVSVLLKSHLSALLLI